MEDLDIFKFKLNPLTKLYIQCKLLLSLNARTWNLSRKNILYEKQAKNDNLPPIKVIIENVR